MLNGVGRRYMFDTNAATGEAFRTGFNGMTSQLDQILEERNQTILDLFRDIAIE